MKRRKFLLGSATAFGATGFVTSTGAFSSAQTERSVNIDIVEDEKALLQLKYKNERESIENCTGPTDLVTLGNLFGTEITIEDFWVETPNDLEVELTVDPPETLEETGDSLDIRFYPTEFRSGKTYVEFGVKVSGTGVNAKTTKNRRVEYDIKCQRGVFFRGRGTVHLRGMGIEDKIDVWTISQGGSATIGHSEGLEPNINGVVTKQGNETIVAVRVNGLIYTHPNLEYQCTTEKWIVSGGGGPDGPTDSTGLPDKPGCGSDEDSG